MTGFSSIPAALEQLKKGGMVIVVDSPDRENQGDCIFAAEMVTSEKVNFLMQQCRGMICVPITKKRALNLELPLMVAPLDNTEKTGIQFTVTVDAEDVEHFGISASDRAKTIRLLSSPDSHLRQLVRPGHVFPLLARDGGVFERAGHTEATIELMRLAGFRECGVLCEVLNERGEVARLPELIDFSRHHEIPIVSIEDLKKYLAGRPLRAFRSGSLVRTAISTLPTKYGAFNISVYRSIVDDREHVALQMGEPQDTPFLARIHSQCITGDVFSSRKCDCRAQLEESLRRIGKKKEGIVIYLNQEGRGVGLTNKIQAYALQEDGLDTVEANEALGLPVDAREYETAAEILREHGIKKVALLTNNPRKVKELRACGIESVERIPLEVGMHQDNKSYLKTKKQKLGHFLKRV